MFVLTPPHIFLRCLRTCRLLSDHDCFLDRGRLVHGNTLTAAVVVENVKAAAAAIPEAKRSDTSGRCVARPPSVFLTGATSKVKL